MIVPPDASLNIQTALQDLDRRLKRLESGPSGVSPDDLNRAKTDLTQAISDATKVRPMNPNNLFRGGPQHAIGLVPDPKDSTGDAVQQILREDAKWVTPLGGLLPIAKYPSTYDSSTLGPQDNIFNLLADLVVNGQVSTGDLLCNNLTVMGAVVPQMGLFAAFSCSGANATFDTTLANEDPSRYTIVSGNIQINSPGTYLVIASVANAGYASGGAVTSGITFNGVTNQSVTGAANSGGTFVPIIVTILGSIAAGSNTGVTNPDAAGSKIFVVFLHP